MAATGYTPIQLYYSTTAAAVPTNTNLANGELAINITDGKLYYKDNTGTVKVIAGAGGAGVAGGSNTQVQYNSSGSLAGSSALTFDGTNLTCTGNITSGGILQALATVQSSSGADLSLNANGANRDVIVKVNGTEQARFVGSTGYFGIGTSSPSARLQINGTTDATQRIIVNGTGNVSSYKLNYNGSEVGFIQNYQNTEMSIGTTVAASLGFNTNNTQRFVITSAGALGIGATPSYGTSGQVLTSGGSGAAPTWTTVGGGTPAGSNTQVQFNNSGAFGASANLTFDGTTLTSTTATASGIALTTTTDGRANIVFKSGGLQYGIVGLSGAVLGTSATDMALFAETGGAIKFFTNGTSSNASTINRYGLGIGAAVPSSGIGIAFPASQSASSNANTLDDYEEGTVTPSVRDYIYDVNCSYTLTSSTGQYTKIGRQVTYSFTMTFATFTAGNGQYFGADLPFAASASTCFTGTLDTSSVVYQGSRTAACVRSVLYSGQVLATFGAMADSSGATKIVSGGVSAGDIISGTIVYFTD